MRVTQPIELEFTRPDGKTGTFRGLITDVEETEGLVLGDTIQVSVSNLVENVITDLTNDDTLIVYDKKCYFYKVNDTTWTVAFSDIRPANYKVHGC